MLRIALAIVSSLALGSCTAAPRSRCSTCGDPPPLPTCAPRAESCDLRDDDCDGAIDEADGLACGACDLCAEVRFGPPDGPVDEERARAGGLRPTPEGALELDSDAGARAHLIWVVNTPEATISKIDSRTGDELGRYLTGPNAPAGDPSRTSVDARGDVYVGNRYGRSVTKISARGGECPDTNGDGVVTTSRGSEVLPWGMDDCVLWHTEVANSPVRGVAAQELFGPDGAFDSVVWVALTDRTLYRLDGATGAITLETVAPVQPYGLALDASGNLWISPHGQEGMGSPFSPGEVFLGRVDTTRCVDDESCDVTPCGDEGDDCVMQRILVPDAIPSYGITVDAAQRVWLGGLAVRRYDPSAPPGERFVTVRMPDSRMMVHGIAVDAEGAVWGAMHDAGVLRLEADEPERWAVVPGTEGGGWKGVAIDHDGRVWAISRTRSEAAILEPGASAADTRVRTGVAPFLREPYVYSDMTGVQLRLATGAHGSYREVLVCGEMAGVAPRWVAVDWDATVPSGTTLLVRVRTADRREDLADARWVVLPATSAPPVYLEPLWEERGVAPGLYLEVEIQLSAPGAATRATPTLRRFAVARVCPGTLI